MILQKDTAVSLSLNLGKKRSSDGLLKNIVYGIDLHGWALHILCCSDLLRQPQALWQIGMHGFVKKKGTDVLTFSLVIISSWLSSLMSFFVPTNTEGTLGQQCATSGYHLFSTLENESVLITEKQIMKISWNYVSVEMPAQHRAAISY